MENTLENKAKFISIYWGQNIFIPKNSIKAWRVPGFIDNAECDYSFDGHIILKPLSSLSDEHAKELSYRLGKVISLDDIIQEKSTDLVKQVVANYSAVDALWMLPARFTDKVREYGYAIDWNEISVEKQIEYGWIKLTEPCEPTK